MPMDMYNNSRAAWGDQFRDQNFNPMAVDWGSQANLQFPSLSPDISVSAAPDLSGVSAGVSSVAEGTSWMDTLFGSSNSETGESTNGAFMPTVKAAAAIGNAYLGYKKLGLAEEQFEFQKGAWQKQFAIKKEEYDYQKAKRTERADHYATWQQERATKQSATGGG